MKKYLKIISSILIFSLLSPLSITAQEVEQVSLSLDFENTDSLPHNFRKTTDLSNVVKGGGNTTGLENLNISGSSQFTSLSFLNLKKNINTKNEFWDIDLRQESHGFINGNAVSWYGPGDKANAGLNYKEVITKEAKQLTEIPFGKSITLDNGKHTLIPTVVENESKLVSSNNVRYLRIAVTDGDRPTDESVDQFVKFVTHLPDNYWLHFHCKEGIGRTTTFMSLFDMIKNSKNVSLDDIINRQFLLGGFNLFKPGDESKRVLFLRNFYRYTKENNDNFKTTWSDWIKQNNITPYTLTTELPKN